MTTTGVILLSLLFIILICGIYIVGQQETIKEQKQVIQIMDANHDRLNGAARQLLNLTREHEELLIERDALRKTLEELK